MKTLFAVLRFAMGVAIVAAIIGQLVVSVNFWTHVNHIENVTTQVVNFLSFFTIDSNILAAVVCIAGAVLLFRANDPRWFVALRFGAVTYMVVTGIVYNLLLRGIALPQGATLGWSNEVLHLIAPLYLLLDWIFAPRRAVLDWRAIWPVLLFPLAWSVYTMVRGPLTYDAVLKRDYWYPYPFLNPNAAPEGYASVAFYIALIAVVIGATATGVVWISRTKLVTAKAARQP